MKPCDECKKNPVCKYRDEVETIVKEHSVDHPVLTVTVKCKYYERPIEMYLKDVKCTSL